MRNPLQSDRLHLGCGTCQPEGWINVDSSWNAWLAAHSRLKWIVRKLRLVPKSQLDLSWRANVIVHDLRKPLIFPDSSMSAVYSSHTLEHLYRADAERLLHEVYRVLKPGGTVRIVVPDLHALARQYLVACDHATDNEISPADQFMRQLAISPELPPKVGGVYAIYQLLTDFHRHKWMYDSHSLRSLMIKAGFERIEERGYL